MKTLLITLFIVSSAQAFTNTFISGNNPFSLTVLDDQGIEVTYQATAFTKGSWSQDWSGENLTFDFGYRTTCGSNLGFLSKDLDITVSINGSKRNLHIEKSSRGRRVFVAGGCPQSTEKITEQLSIWTEKNQPLISTQP